ncbi:hypothetical protein CYMTET_35791, partial [Cymbomonas tetramitiformis]
EETGSGYGFAVGKDGTVCWSVDSGETWDLLRYEGFTMNEGTVLAVGDRDTLLLSNDSGTTWMSRSSGLPEPCLGCWHDWRDVHFETTSLGWVVGGFGTIIHSSDGGAVWQRQVRAAMIPAPAHRLTLSCTCAATASGFTLTAACT